MPKKKSPNSVRLRNSTAEFLTFAYQTGGDGVEVRVQDGTIWLSQKNIGLLFETTPENVLMHLKNIYAENELPEEATAKEFLAVQTEGKRQVQRSILHYNLDAIIAVGYRVNSKRATAFRQWATGVLRDYTLRGYVMDRKRMENGAFLGDDYFKRHAEELGLTFAEIDVLLDAICARGEEWQLTPGWLPILPDPDDEPLVQLAYDSAARRIVTHNLRHLRPARALGIEVLPPREFAPMIPAP